MPDAINLDEQFARFNDPWSPQIVGELNGQHVKLAKLAGDKCPWHAHDNEDEMFLVVAGAIEIHQRDAVVTVRTGEFYIVPRGVEHRVIPQGEVRLILFEPASTAHTGNVQSEITRKEYRRLVP